MKGNLNKKLLIVEDESQLLKVLTDQFEKEGFTVFACKNGKAGIDLAIKHNPDLMIVDVVMPEMDGLTMLQHLKNNSETKNIPAIVLTNLSDPQTTADALKAGAYDHLVKTDWDIADLVNRVKVKLGI
jgi:DNA-binding response OmpR family regulator